MRLYFAILLAFGHYYYIGLERRDHVQIIFAVPGPSTWRLYPAGWYATEKHLPLLSSLIE